VPDEEEKSGELKQIRQRAAEGDLDAGVQVAVELVEESTDARKAGESFAVDGRHQFDGAGS
jgi:hypothetical protein